MDWRQGQKSCLERLPGLAGKSLDPSALDRARMEAEQRMQAGAWRPYREILADSLTRAVQETLGLTLPSGDARTFGESMADWPAYPDSPAALQRLAGHCTLGLLSNCDASDLARVSKEVLGLEDVLLISSEAVHSYKPSEEHWHAALRRLDCAPEEILHVSAYSYYDLTPAHHLGFDLAFLARDDEQAPTQLPLAYRARDLADLAGQLGC